MTSPLKGITLALCGEPTVVGVEGVSRDISLEDWQ